MLDRVVSSYTPTLRALIEIREARSPVGLPGRLLTVGMPDTAGLEPLPQVDDELTALRDLFPAVTELRGTEATRQAVREALRGHPWTHLSCHGGQNLGRPSRGGIVLAEGTLTIADLHTDRFGQGEFAFLSACRTAMGGATVPDEVITMASALQYAGWRRVIGTLWPVGADTAARLCTRLYARLTGTGRFDPEPTAYALHDAVCELRADDPRQPARWAAFIQEAPEHMAVSEPSPDLSPDVIHRLELAVELSNDGLHEHAEPELRALLADFERQLGPLHEETIALYDRLGHTLYQLERLPEAEAMHREALSRSRRAHGLDHADTLAYAHNLGAALSMAGHTEEGIGLLTDTAERRERLLGPDHPETLETSAALGSILYSAGRTAHGLSILERAHGRCLAVLGRDADQTMRVCSDLVAALYTSGRRQEAAAMLAGLLRTYERVFGPDDIMTLRTRQRLMAMGWFPG
ncbi:CHAT domain-containing protein [Streptomyces sp. NPDC048297]|uniref:CHAT domain-containing protein n=1 Tax=Streptomyces sp. NPDC048297 TaxID=3365531 RepID=UPI003711769F